MSQFYKVSKNWIGSAWIVSLALAFAAPALSQSRGPAPVFVQEIQPREFSVKIEALGTLEPNEMVDLTLNVADRVQSLYFDDGQRVKKGKTLLSLAQREQIALTEASEATLAEAEQRLERLKRLVESKAVSQAELEAVQRDVNSASAQLRAVQSRQKDRILVAPFDGILGFRQVSVGSFVSPGTVVARLIDDSEMNLEFAVPSVFLRTLKPGTKITATTDDFPDELFRGEITTLDNQIDPVTRSVKVRATLPNPDRILLSGMFMQVTLIANPRSAPALPEEAIQPIGPRSFIFVVEESESGLTARRTEITLGARDKGYIEVQSGVKTGQRVITEGLLGVRDGGAIKLQSLDLLDPRINSAKRSGAPASGSSSGQ